MKNDFLDEVENIALNEKEMKFFQNVLIRQDTVHEPQRCILSYQYERR